MTSQPIPSAPMFNPFNPFNRPGRPAVFALAYTVDVRGEPCDVMHCRRIDGSETFTLTHHCLNPFAPGFALRDFIVATLGVSSEWVERNATVSTGPTHVTMGV